MFGFLVGTTGLLHADDTTAFRGDWSGKSSATGLPTTWDADSNVVWKQVLRSVSTLSHRASLPTPTRCGRSADSCRGL